MRRRAQKNARALTAPERVPSLGDSDPDVVRPGILEGPNELGYGKSRYVFIWSGICG